MNRTATHLADPSPTIVHRLQRVGSSLVDAASARPGTRPTMVANPRPRRRSIPTILGIALAGGGVTISALAFAGSKTPDPIVGVIPKNAKTSDIRWFKFDEPNVDSPTSYSHLLMVAGLDVVLEEAAARQPAEPTAVGRTVIDDVSVDIRPEFRVSSVGSIVGARWNRSGTEFSLTVPADALRSRPIIERLVMATKPTRVPGTSLPGADIQEVARWPTFSSERSFSLTFEPRLTQTTDGTTRVETSGISGATTTLSNDELRRIDSVYRNPTPRVRVGQFAVSSRGRGAAALRPIRRSEARRLVHRVDIARAKQVTGPWASLSTTMEAKSIMKFGSFIDGLCVRSGTSVACGEYRVNRLVGKTWVYASPGRPSSDVRFVTADGTTLTTTDVFGVNSVYVIPDGVDSITIHSRQAVGQSDFIYTVRRPKY